MRHGHGLRKLNRTTSHRLAMLRNMMNSLIQHEAIKTTLPKAKELRRVIEPILTMGKTDTLAYKRLAFSRLRDREMVLKLFAELGPRYANRNGGYLRILKMSEWDLLAALARDLGKVVTQRRLLTEVWGPAHAEDSQYLRVYVGQLRAKLGAAAGLLRTEPGVGYRLLEQGG